MKALGSVLVTVAAGLIGLAVAAPILIRLSSSIVLPVVVVAGAFVGCRLVFYHTRRW